jgi:hypothetical protein
VPLEVRVWNFVVPREQHLDTCFPLRPDDLQKFYRLKEVPLEMFERWVDFCNERRVCPALSDWHRYSTDMERLAARQ